MAVMEAFECRPKESPPVAAICQLWLRFSVEHCIAEQMVQAQEEARNADVQLGHAHRLNDGDANVWGGVTHQLVPLHAQTVFVDGDELMIGDELEELRRHLRQVRACRRRRVSVDVLQPEQAAAHRE